MFPRYFVFSCFILALSAVALNPASKNPDSDPASPVHHDIKRNLALNLDNTTSPLTPTSLNTTNSFEPICYHPSQLLPLISLEDCYKVLYDLLTAPNALDLKRWDRSTELPVEYAFQTCSLIMARAAPVADDLFQPVLIAHAAALVVQKCVTESRMYQGGLLKIGVRRQFAVYISAKDAMGEEGAPSATA